jgi:branched-chain amino acid transport system ATP-binding protein
MLSIRDYSGGYRQGVTIIERISLDLAATPVTSIVGSNGAGKSTLLLGICGLLEWHTGEIHFDGQRIDKLAPHRVAQRGIRMVPSGRGTFQSMTVRENLEVGAYGLSSNAKARRIEREFARFPRLKERSGQQAGMMSGGEQQMLAIARAMMSDPRVLILDEPSQGLAPIIVDQIFDLIPQLAKSNVQILLVEQDVGRGLEVSDVAHVVEKGRISMSGKSADLTTDKRIKESYLGIA